jgi:tetratricopeptide (TPR) repeat protein
MSYTRRRAAAPGPFTGGRSTVVASDVELSEVFRLGEAAGKADIVREVGDQLAARWMRASRFREAEALTSRSLRVQSRPSTLLVAGQAQERTGNPAAALNYFERALPIFREVGDRAGQANTLSNIGVVHRRRRDWQVARHYYERALPIFRDVRDRAGQAATLNNIGMAALRSGGRAGRARLLQAGPAHLPGGRGSGR